MALPLKDVRLGLPHETHAVLNAYAKAHGEDLYDVIRGVLAVWASRTIHETSVLHRELRRDGLVLEQSGVNRE